MEQSYHIGTLDSAALSNELSYFWNEMRHDASLRKGISKSGINLQDLENQLDDVGQDNAICFSEKGAGLSGAEVAIIVAFAPLADKVLYDLWKSFILPWLLQRNGHGSIGDPND